MRDRRLLIALGAVAALALLFVALRPGADDETPAAATTAATSAAATTTQAATTTAADEPPAPENAAADIRLRGGRPLGGIVRIEAKQGERVLIVVRSEDVRDHVHVHGYDLMRDVGPGRPAQFSFVAKLTGRFEIELEEAGRQIAQITVTP